MAQPVDTDEERLPVVVGCDAHACPHEADQRVLADVRLASGRGEHPGAAYDQEGAQHIEQPDEFRQQPDARKDHPDAHCDSAQYAVQQYPALQLWRHREIGEHQ
ncbi:hypothetical protein G6F22_019329 [Rhizopus arrhizus]|nr:hypothetical protein G6F22_019329 [Rhizopus arrhizus]